MSSVEIGMNLGEDRHAVMQRRPRRLPASLTVGMQKPPHRRTMAASRPAASMAHQIYLVSLHAAHCDSDAVRDDLAQLIHGVGGFVLMAAGSEALIAAVDERYRPLLERHEAVAFCGGLSLNPNGAAADKLRRLFAVNVAAQLGARCGAADASSPTAQAAGPRHRPLVWHRPAHQHPARATGVSITTPSISQR